MNKCWLREFIKHKWLWQSFTDCNCRLKILSYFFNVSCWSYKTKSSSNFQQGKIPSKNNKNLSHRLNNAQNIIKSNCYVIRSLNMWQDSQFLFNNFYRTFCQNKCHSTMKMKVAVTLQRIDTWILVRNWFSMLQSTLNDFIHNVI